MAQNSSAKRVSETEFEKRRGINRVEVREGYAQVHISDLSAPLVTSRLEVLQCAADSKISFDFLKFTPDGMSFVVLEDMAPVVEKCLSNFKSINVEVQKGCNVVMVHAVNMRDEEGLIASIVLQAIRSGAAIGHVSDMHDRVLMVVSKDHSARLKDQLEGSLVKVHA